MKETELNNTCFIMKGLPRKQNKETPFVGQQFWTEFKVFIEDVNFLMSCRIRDSNCQTGALFDRKFKSDILKTNPVVGSITFVI